MWPGMMREKICLPVHKGRGFRMAGCGTFPSHVDRNISRFITSPCTRTSNGSFQPRGRAGEGSEPTGESRLGRQTPGRGFPKLFMTHSL